MKKIEIMKFSHKENRNVEKTKEMVVVQKTANYSSADWVDHPGASLNEVVQIVGNEYVTEGLAQPLREHEFWDSAEGPHDYFVIFRNIDKGLTDNETADLKEKYGYR